jgi:hypothetical protein
MTVREALSKWNQILSKLPRGTEIQIQEEGASPGAGVEMVISLVVYDDMTAVALAIRAGTYDGEPRVFATVATGSQDEVAVAVNEWKRHIDRE